MAVPLRVTAPIDDAERALFFQLVIANLTPGGHIRDAAEAAVSQMADLDRALQDGVTGRDGTVFRIDDRGLRWHVPDHGERQS